MKFFVLCLVFLVAGAYAVELTAQQQKAVRFVVQFCTKLGGTTLETVKAMHKGHWDNVDDKAKSYFACSATVNGFVVFGIRLESALRARFAPVFGSQATDAAITACRGTNGTGFCDKSFNLFTCLYENGIQVPIDFV